MNPEETDLQNLQWCNKQFFWAITSNVAVSLVLFCCICSVVMAWGTEGSLWVDIIAGAIAGAGIVHSFKVESFIRETVIPMANEIMERIHKRELQNPTDKKTS